MEGVLRRGFPKKVHRTLPRRVRPLRRAPYPWSPQPPNKKSHGLALAFWEGGGSPNVILKKLDLFLRWRARAVVVMFSTCGIRETSPMRFLRLPASA